MAVTKTHPIKSTLKAAIDYILNPEKTDGKLLASSFGCGLETADIEFAWTREAAGDRGTHLGRHLIQSFAVGETTPEEAHKIGMELAGAVLGGKYEFVLTTHVDKDHLHNHLIFNAVSFVDYKKYHSNKQSYHFIRRTSDRICKEHVEKCKNELLHKAIEDSIQKAQVLTTAANVKLGEIQAIDYSWGEIDFVTKPLNEMRLMECTECEMSAPGAYDIDIEADDINVTDTATVIWEIA